MGYVNLGLAEDALAILSLPGSEARRRSGGLDSLSCRTIRPRCPRTRILAFQFPFRRESLPVLAWADEHSDAWAWTYFRALNLWAVDRTDEAASLMNDLGDRPDFAPFYVARSLPAPPDPGAARDSGSPARCDTGSQTLECCTST